MAHEEAVVAGWLETARHLLRQWVGDAPMEALQRLNSIQTLVDESLRVLELGLFQAVFERLRDRAEDVGRKCPRCGLGCERERKSVRIRTTRIPLQIEVWRYRCRSCQTNRSPLREWLGLESGMTSIGLDRMLASFAMVMSFGESSRQMLEHHGHDVNRTLVERRVYAAGQHAVTYLEERRKKRLDEYMSEVGVRPGVAQVFVQVDSGGVPVGKLERPERDPTDKTQELTPVRRPPKGRRPKSKREIRTSIARRPDQVDGKVIDLHVAQLKCPEYTGERLYIAALEVGLGDQTAVHCTSDMAQWQTIQFEEQFGAQSMLTICADFYHTLEYISAAGKAFAKEPHKLGKWIGLQGRRLKEGAIALILRDLRKHQCSAHRCPRTDQNECAVFAAIRYLSRNRRFMKYPKFIAEGLPIGSGEVEGLIRHIVRRRLDIPGDWREHNLELMTALLTIYHCGWWNDFWAWVDEVDKQAFKRRQNGEGLNRFRGPQMPRELTQGYERLDLDDLSPLFDAA